VRAISCTRISSYGQYDPKLDSLESRFQEVNLVGTELRPLGVKCNIRCHYCYQNPQRDADNLNSRYDMEAMKAAVEREGKPFTLFGGEALLVPERDLAELWSWGQIMFGGNGVQTNGSLINDRHIQMFKKYRVSVGISIDGPGKFNDIRWAGSLDATRITTARTEAAIRRLCHEKIYPSLIVTLHRGNATEEKLPLLIDWLQEMEQLGVRSVRLHILEVDSPRVRDLYTLTDEENIRAFLYFAEAESSFTRLRFDVFEDIRRLLRGKDKSTTCIWNACDQYTTAAVRGVEGNGQRSNCGRTNKDGIDYVKGAKPGYERYVALYQTPYKNGGCSGCRFFAMCKGQCPGTAMGNDWRNRSEHCRVWMVLFAYFEKQLQAAGETPLSLAPVRQALERELVSLWATGENSSLEDSLRRLDSAYKPATVASLKTSDSCGAYLPCHEFVRSVWVSDRASSEWEEKIRHIAAAWRRLEWKTVVKGIRPSAMLWTSREELAALDNTLRSAGLKTLVLQVLDRGLPQTDDRVIFRVALGTSRTLKAFRSAWIRQDANAIGELLGYPHCCRAAFDLAASSSSLTESSWRAASAAGALETQCNPLDVTGPPQVNPLLSRIGVRLIPHEPCSFACAQSFEMAERFRTATDTTAELEALDAAAQMLSWPMSWSAANGIAEVKTPVIKICYDTKRSLHKRSIHYLGVTYPAIGASGLQFPFRVLNACH
jgi:uncharacterized protein